jgi:hypothetical protein
MVRAAFFFPRAFFASRGGDRIEEFGVLGAEHFLYRTLAGAGRPKDEKEFSFHEFNFMHGF